MNSSTGFKKRSLLRPMSGLQQKQKQFLRSVDISQSEPMIASQLKTQIQRIQDQITQIDKDKKIRSGESTLQRSYALMMKKWMRDGTNALQKEDQDGKILKQMGVDTYEAGFRKLWKILVNLDNVVSKITQLEIIQFLKYDESFNQICTDSQKGNQLLNTIGKAGFIPSTFQISQVLLQRNKDLYSSILQSKRKGSFLTSTSNQKFQKHSAQNNRSQTNELILQLQKENSKLAQMLQQLQKEKQNQQRQIKQIKSKEIKQSCIKESVKINNGNYNSTNSSTTNHSNPQDLFTQLEDRYTQKISTMSNQIQKLQVQISQIKIKLGSAQTLLKIAQQELKGKQFQTKHVKSGSYQQALQEQMQKMKKGFQKKINKLTQQFNQKEKDLRRKQIDYRNQNDKIKWQKSLLLKKFQTLAVK